MVIGPITSGRTRLLEGLMQEKRKYKRKKITIDVDYDISKDQKWFDSTSLDISAGGMCLVSREPLQVDSSVKLKFIIPDSDKPLFVTGVVIWNEKFLKKNNNTSYYNGIKFTRIDAEDRAFINKYVESTTFDKK